jgi:hypothetical protein
MTSGSLLAYIMYVVQVALYLFRWLEHRGKVNDARKAVEQDLVRLSAMFQRRAAAARANIDSTPAGMRDDPNNRDNTEG